MLPDLDSIACFVAAARTLNFRAAAKSVSLTPAAFGKRIAQLETLVGHRLFQRTTRHVSLTPNGEAMLPEALRLLDMADECVRAGRERAGPAPVRVTIGTGHELGLAWLVPMLPLLNECLPNLDVNFYFGSGPDLEERVRALDIHCAVTSRGFADPLFDALRLKKEGFVFVGSASLLAHRPFLHAEDAKAHVLIDVEQSQPLYRYFREAESAPASLRFRHALIMGTAAAVRALVHAGEGVAVLPHYLVKSDLDNGSLVPLFPEVEMRCDYFRLMYRSDDPKMPLYAELAKVMRSRPLTT